MTITRMLEWIARAALAVVLVWAGFLKAIHPGQLQLDIERYRLVSPSAAWLTAAYLPWLEIVVGASLIAWRRSAAPLLLTTSMFATFATAIASAWWRGLDIQCGCFGAHAMSTSPNYPWLLTRDLLLLGATLWLTSRSPHFKPVARDATI